MAININTDSVNKSFISFLDIYGATINSLTSMT
jgi:hypothetical protein